jgi:hypothetical protein
LKIILSSDVQFHQITTKLLEVQHYQPCMHHPQFQSYYQNYSGENFQIHSAIFEIGSQQAILQITHDKSSRQLGYFGLPALLIFSPETSLGDQYKMSKAIVKYIEKLQADTDAMSIKFEEFTPSKTIGKTIDYYLNHGAELYCTPNSVIDLTQSSEILWSQVRKRYKSLINKGKSLLDLQIIDHTTVNKELFSQFQALHLEVAGKKTRSDETWKIQLQDIEQGHAFLVAGLFENKLVSANYYQQTSSTAYYGVGVSKRDEEHQNRSHVLMWSAMEYMQRIGLSYFDIGQSVFKKIGLFEPTEKELHIDTFKKGFGGSLYPRYVVKYIF